MRLRINDLEDVAIARDLLSHPGETLSETIGELGIGQAELAERMGRPKKTISEIVNGTASITPDTATQLERVLGVPAHFWLNAERNYRNELAELNEKERLLSGEQECLKFFPVKELKQRGVLTDVKEIPELLHQLWSFFKVSSLDTFHSYYATYYVQQANFKKSNKHQESIYALSAWLRLGEQEAEKLKLKDYDAARFAEVLEELKTVVQKQPKDFWKKAQQACAEAGVCLVYVPALSKAPASGAAHWLPRNPIIQLSNRYKTNDHFWFAFYHEAGHVMKHGKKNVFVEDMEGWKNIAEKENEANAFATEMLISSKHFNTIEDYPKVDEQLITELATKWKTHAGIIVGRLQKLECIGYNRFNNLKVKTQI